MFVLIDNRHNHLNKSMGAEAGMEEELEVIQPVKDYSFAGEIVRNRVSNNYKKVVKAGTKDPNSVEFQGAFTVVVWADDAGEVMFGYAPGYPILRKLYKYQKVLGIYVLDTIFDTWHFEQFDSKKYLSTI